MEEKLLCIGCGIQLQSEDESKEGYVNPNALTRSFILCKRCYQLKHYGKFSQSNQLKNTIDLLNFDPYIIPPERTFCNTKQPGPRQVFKLMCPLTMRSLVRG